MLERRIIMSFGKEFVKGFIEAKMREALTSTYISLLAIKNASIDTLKETTEMSEEEARQFVNELDEQIFLEVSQSAAAGLKQGEGS